MLLSVAACPASHGSGAAVGAGWWWWWWGPVGVHWAPRPSPSLIHCHAAAQANRSCSRDWRQTRRGGDSVPLLQQLADWLTDWGRAAGKTRSGSKANGGSWC